MHILLESDLGQHFCGRHFYFVVTVWAHAHNLFFYWLFDWPLVEALRDIPKSFDGNFPNIWDRVRSYLKNLSQASFHILLSNFAKRNFLQGVESCDFIVITSIIFCENFIKFGEYAIHPVLPKYLAEGFYFFNPHIPKCWGPILQVVEVEGFNVLHKYVIVLR